MPEKSLENYKVLIPYYECYPEVLLIEITDDMVIESMISNKGMLYKKLEEYHFNNKNIRITIVCKWEGGAYEYFVDYKMKCDYKIMNLKLFHGIKKFLKENQGIDYSIQTDGEVKQFEFRLNFSTYEDMIGDDYNYIELIAERFEFYILHEVFPIFEKYKLEMSEYDKSEPEWIYD